MAERRSVKEIFGEAVELPPGQRAAFLDRACGGEEALRAELEALLMIHAGAGGFLAAPTQAGGANPATGHPASASADPSAAGERPGAVIGRYRLLEPIGEGGFGVVFRAEQREPVLREVALKIIKLGMDTRQVIARFEAERQALAMMDHPNIARVLDAGATESGRPFFVMELVRGEPITAYCDRRHVTIPHRLGVFEEVCAAVQHAHQKGVIHRDLKPSNVLVAEVDGRALPKVIDFGIAKATGRSAADRTTLTEARQLIGTPEYMSPEQAAGSRDIDTRSDVYALGVLLYELLTGTTPFDADRLRSAEFGEMQRIIREEDPPRPSTRLSTLESLPSVAARRRTEPRRLGSALRGDLDWIVMKCLEKDRARRYESASGLAADVRRHLAGQPVLAAPPGVVYRARKFARRHRRGVAAAALVAAACLAAVAGVSVALQRAREEAHRTRAFNAFSRRMLTSLGPEKAGSYDVSLMRDMLAGATVSAAAEFAGQPRLHADVLVMIGETFRALALYPEAERTLTTAWELRRAALGPEHHDTVMAHAALAGVFLEAQDFAAAEAALREIARIRARRLGASHPLTLDALHGVAHTIIEAWDPARLAEGTGLCRRVLEARRRLPDTDRAVAQSLVTLGTALRRAGDLEGAAAALQESLARCRAVGSSEGVATALVALGRLELERGRLVEAEEHLREGLGMRRTLLGPRHSAVSFPAMHLSTVLAARGAFDEAEAMAREALEIRRERFGDAHAEVTEALWFLAGAVAARGDAARARPIYEEVLARRLGALGPDHPDVAACRQRLAELANAGPGR